LYPELADAVAADPRLARHVRMEIWRRFGFFPTESSEHAAEYVPWFMSREAEIRRLGIPVGEYLGRVGQNLHIYEELRRGLAAGRPMLTRWQDPEIASEVLVAMLTGDPRRVNLTVPNEGLIPALPAGCFVEVPATVDGGGIAPGHVEGYPVQLAALNRTYANVAELTVRAVLDANPRHIRHAAMLDPNTAASLPLTAIAKLCDEMIEAHRDLLPAAIAGSDLKGEA
jgi:alpha-galactosidase